MSGTSPDDRELDRLLSETAGVRQRYRESSLDQPSAQLDEAIRAAARREVSARPRLAGSPFSGSWRIPLSIAAVVLVSATVTLMVVDREVHVPVAGDTARPVPAPPPERDAPAARPPMSTPKAARQSAAPATSREKGAAVLSDTAVGAESEERDQSRASEAQTAEAKSKAASPAKAPQPEPFPAQAKLAAPPPAPAGSPDQNIVRSDLRRLPPPADVAQPAASATPSRDALSRTEVPREATAAETGAKAKDEAAPRDARAPPAAPTSPLRARSSEAFAPAAPAAEERATAGALEKKQTVSTDSNSGPSAKPWEQDPRAWLKHVDELRAAGRVEDAKASFKAFRSRYPDYPLPAGFVVPGS